MPRRRASRSASRLTRLPSFPGRERPRGGPCATGCLSRRPLARLSRSRCPGAGLRRARLGQPALRARQRGGLGRRFSGCSPTGGVVASGLRVTKAGHRDSVAAAPRLRVRDFPAAAATAFWLVNCAWIGAGVALLPASAWKGAEPGGAPLPAGGRDCLANGTKQFPARRSVQSEGHVWAPAAGLQGSLPPPRSQGQWLPLL